MKNIKRKDAEYEDHYSPDPNTVNSAECGVCGAAMTVNRNINGPTQWVMAVSGSKRLHDSFSCPLKETSWHIKLKALQHLANDTPSKTIKAIYEKDIEEIIKENVKHGN